MFGIVPKTWYDPWHLFILEGKQLGQCTTSGCQEPIFVSSIQKGHSTQLIPVYFHTKHHSQRIPGLHKMHNRRCPIIIIIFYCIVPVLTVLSFYSITIPASLKWKTIFTFYFYMLINFVCELCLILFSQFRNLYHKILTLLKLLVQNLLPTS